MKRMWLTPNWRRKLNDSLAVVAQTSLLSRTRQAEYRSNLCRLAVAALLAGGFVTGIAAVADDAGAGKAWWAHVAFLADDSIEGRKAGTPGHRKAAEYVATQFEKAKLQPAGKSGYIQPVPFQVRQIDESRSKVELIREGTAETMVFGREATLAPRGKSGEVVEAEAVFVGYGLTIPEKNVDDLKGLDLKGRIAVILSGAPNDIPGALAAHAQSVSERWKVLRAAGAIGTASLYNPQRADVPWERANLARLSPVLILGVPELVETEGMQVSLGISPQAGDRLLVGTGHTTAELMAADKSGQPLPKFPLKVRIRTQASFSEKSAISENVIGVLPGSDPKLKSEYVVFSAHLDHLGVGQPVPSNPDDRIYNGAMDNASGIASMIEVAKSLGGKKLKRSVLFAAVTGEEGGLLGSKFFANMPTVPADRMVADLNADMFLPIIPLKGITVLGLDESDLGKEFADVARRFGVPVKPDPEPKRNLFIRSDQYSFIRQGIPSLAFKFHSDPGTPEKAVMDAWLRERYHAPSDDINQPVNLEGAVQFNKVMTAFVQNIADRPTRPKWYPESFFTRYAKPTAP